MAHFQTNCDKLYLFLRKYRDETTKMFLIFITKLGTKQLPKPTSQYKTFVWYVFKKERKEQILTVSSLTEFNNSGDW